MVGSMEGVNVGSGLPHGWLTIMARRLRRWQIVIVTRALVANPPIPKGQSRLGRSRFQTLRRTLSTLPSLDEYQHAARLTRAEVLEPRR